MLRVPPLVVFQHGVEDREQLPHAGGGRDLEWLAGGAQALVEDPQHRIVLATDERGHVAHGAHRGTAAPDHAFAAHRAAIAIHRCDTDESRDLMAGEVAELGQGRQQREHGDRPDARHAAQQIRLRLVERARCHGVLQIAVHIGEPFLEPADVLGEIALHRAAGEAEAILLGGEHVDDLPTAGEQAFEQLGRFIRQGAGRGPHPLCEVGEHAGIERVGLRQLPHGLGEVAHLPRVHDGDGEPVLGERDRREHLETAGGFHDDEDGGEGHESRGQFGETLVIVSDGSALPVGEGGEVERRLRDIDADEAVHKRLRARNDRRGPTLRDAGSSARQLFGLSAINDGWHPG